MGFWFENGDARRFPRIEMPVQIYISPVKPIRDKDIFGLGIDYFPPSVEKKIQKTKLDLWHWIKHIQEQRDILEPVFIEVVDLIDTFGEVIKGVCIGKNPAANPNTLLTLRHLQNGFLGINTLREPAPKTFQYFDSMNQKFLIYAENLVQSLQKSTPTQFALNTNFQTEFDIDKTIANFEKPKFKQVPLAQSLYYLAQYINLHLEAYSHFLKDLQPVKMPKQWEKEHASVSACGIAIHVPKRFPLNSKVETNFYFSETDEVLKLKATIVRCNSLPKEQSECNALDFDFPTSSDQSLIQRQLEQFQITRCLAFGL
ncbi:MAG: PilZ domain-containing protein [Thiotrichales bacterium]|nr:PilZ domain-containing protein [Thiotrichales bacterium]